MRTIYTPRSHFMTFIMNVFVFIAHRRQKRYGEFLLKEHLKYLLEEKHGTLNGHHYVNQLDYLIRLFGLRLDNACYKNVHEMRLAAHQAKVRYYLNAIKSHRKICHERRKLCFRFATNPGADTANDLGCQEIVLAKSRNYLRQLRSELRSDRERFNLNLSVKL